MYATPLLVPISIATAEALCCHVYVSHWEIPTGMCDVPWCELFGPVVEGCSLTVGPVTVTGN